MTTTDWTLARCRPWPELFFPTGYTRGHQRQIDEAKAICARCPIRVACLAEALTREAGNSVKNLDGNGIQGGLTPRERFRLSQQNPTPVPA